MRPRHPIFSRFRGREARSYKLIDQNFDIRSWSAALAPRPRGRGPQDRCRHRDFTPKPQVGCTRHSFARLASSCALSSTSSFAAVAPCLASRIRRQPHRLSLGEPSMARCLSGHSPWLFHCAQVFLELRPELCDTTSTPLAFYIHLRQQCVRCPMHPSSILNGASIRPPFPY